MTFLRCTVYHWKKLTQAPPASSILLAAVGEGENPHVVISKVTRLQPRPNPKFKGRLEGCTPSNVPGWYLLCSLGILGDNLPINTHCFGRFLGISHRGTLVGVHPTIPWKMPSRWMQSLSGFPGRKSKNHILYTQKWWDDSCGNIGSMSIVLVHLGQSKIRLNILLMAEILHQLIW